MDKLSTIPLPILYNGWVIQPMWDGRFEVYPRIDTAHNRSATCLSIGEAFELVNTNCGLESV